MNVETIVLLGGCFPGDIRVTIRRFACARHERAVVNTEVTCTVVGPPRTTVVCVELPCARQIEETADSLVITDLSDRAANLEIRNNATDGLPEFLGRNNPTERSRREETETLALGKVLRSIVTHVEVNHILGLVVVGDASHHAHITTGDGIIHAARIVVLGFVIQNESADIMVAKLAGVVQTCFSIPVSAAPFCLVVTQRPRVALTDIDNLRRTVVIEFPFGDSSLVTDTAACGACLLLCIVRVIGSLDTEIESFGNKVEFKFVLKVEVHDTLTLGGITMFVDQAETIGTYRTHQVGIGDDATSLVVETVARHGRTIVEKSLDTKDTRLTVVLTIANGVATANASADTDGKRAQARQINIQIGTEVITAVFEVGVFALVEGLEQSVLIEHTDRDEIAGTFCTTRHIDVILFLPGMVVHQICKPVGVWIDGWHIHILPVLDGFLREFPSVFGHSFHFLGMVVGRSVFIGAGRFEESGNLLQTSRSRQ